MSTQLLRLSDIKLTMTHITDKHIVMHKLANYTLSFKLKQPPNFCATVIKFSIATQR